MIVFPNCKINLGLHILRKRADGFHDLQTVFYPFPLTDALEAVQHTHSKFELSLSGLALDGVVEDNICYKAWQLLKRDFPHLPGIKMHLHKTIPAGAGLGGGSADGAFTLLLLNKKFNLGLDEAALETYALQLGSDCPFFIRNRPCLATGRGEAMEALQLDLSPYRIVLVNPGIHVNTGWAFSKIRPSAERPSLKALIQSPATWRETLTNDFEAPVFAAHPEIGAVKQRLYDRGAVYASMSGSGSTVYGLFEKKQALKLDFPAHYFLRSLSLIINN